MSYNILRWDVIRFKDSITDVPIVYIKPDASLLAFITTNKGACILEINGTHKPYDGQKIQGVIYQSSELPNPRPVYFKQTGEYIIVLNSGWYGYPTSFGEITFYGLDNAKSSNLKSVIPVKTENTKTFILRNQLE